MNLQSHSKGRPGVCAVIPGRAHDPEGFVTTNVVISGWDPEVVVSVAGVKELMRTCQFPSPEAYKALESERDMLLNQVAELGREVEELARFADAIDTIESRDFRARKRPGRKPQKETVDV